MQLRIKRIESEDGDLWDGYVRGHVRSSLYQLSGWKNVIQKTYSHKSHYLMAVSEERNRSGDIVGILPLIHMKHLLFGNKLVSIPFFDLGGVLADSQEIEERLVNEAVKVALDLGASVLEFRHTEPISCMAGTTPVLSGACQGLSAMKCITRPHKVRMLLELPDSSDVLLKTFKAKLRSQIKAPMKEGLKAKIGGRELLDDFYSVFSENMRDLGSPVHSIELMRNVLAEFSVESKIVAVYKENRPLACSLMIGYRDVLENPWASSLRAYSKLSPNMLLYWTMLQYGADHGYRFFDFGRSSEGEGTFKFKEQWGAKPTPLNWQYMVCNGEIGPLDEKSKLGWAVYVWKRLPERLTRLMGPPLRKHIAL